MARMNYRNVLLRPQFWVGILLVVLASGGILLFGVGLLSLPPSPRGSSVMARQTFVPSLRDAGVPERKVQAFIMGQVLSRNELAALPKDQARALEAAQQGSARVTATNRSAIDLARQRCFLSLVFCAALFVFGIALCARVIKRARSQSRVPPLLQPRGS